MLIANNCYSVSHRLAMLDEGGNTITDYYFLSDGSSIIM